MILRLRHNIGLLLTCISTLFLSSCLNPTDYTCISPDNFGNFTDLTVNSRSFTANPGFGGDVFSVGLWQDTGQLVSGIEPLVVVVNNSDNSLKSEWRDGEITHTKGKGLYMLLADPDINPNDDYKTVMNPASTKNHIFYMECSGSTCPVDKGMEAGGIVIDDSTKYAGKKIYFKILDSDYTNNTGSYSITIKSGLYKNSNDPITNLVLLVESHVKKAMKKIYDGIINNTLFQVVIKLSLMAYLSFYCLLFVIGMIRGSVGQFFVIISKIGIVLTLISPTAYNQLYDLFTDFFLGGLYELSSIVTGFSGSTPGGIFGGILQSVANDAIFNKLVGLVYANFGMGILLFIIYIIVLAILACSVVYAAFLFILSVMSIAFLIAIAPFFVPFILFQKTMDTIFNNYMKVLTASMLQVVLVVSFYAFFRDVVMHYFHRNMGYRVCWTVVVDLKILKFYNWKVDIDGTIANIDIPATFTDQNGRICKPYMCKGYRYVNLPYLIPAPDRIPADAGYSSPSLSQDQLDKLFIAGYTNDQDLIDNFFDKHAPTINEAGMLIGVIALFFFASIMISPIAKQLSGMSFTWGNREDGAGTALDKADMLSEIVSHNTTDRLIERGIKLSRKLTGKFVENSGKSIKGVAKYTYRETKTGIKRLQEKYKNWKDNQ